MGRAKPKKPRDIGATIDRPDEPAIKRLAPEERGDTYEASGVVTPIKRRDSVFLILRNSGSLTPTQSASASRLMALYATLRGVGEAPTREDVEDYCDRSTLEPAHIAILRAKGVVFAEEQYRRACRRIGPHSAALLTMLFHDFMEGDHEPPVINANGKVQARWRVKVRAFYASRGKALATANEENLAVWIACDELQRAF